MFDIFHRYTITAPPERIFEAIATPRGLDAWWTLRASGEPRVGCEYHFFFDESFDWRGRVTCCVAARSIEWEITAADADWTGTRLAFELTVDGKQTVVDFRHLGWRERNSHYATTSYCWVTHLRLLKRFVETGQIVPYAERDAS